MKKLILLVVVAVLMCGTTAMADLLNPSFESPAGGDDSWQYEAGDYWDVLDTGLKDPADGAGNQPTDGAQFIWFSNWNGVEDGAYAKQMVGTIQANTLYSLDIDCFTENWALYNEIPVPRPFYEIAFEIYDGSTPLGTIVAATQLDAPLPDELSWVTPHIQFSTVDMPELVGYTLQVHLSGHLVGMDNAQYVPEPATMILLGLGSLVLRRKKA